MAIAPISANSLPLAGIGRSASGAGAQSTAGGFGDLIGDALQQLNQVQTEANSAMTDVAAGRSTDLHTALVTVEEASLALQLALQVRNKMVESYQEVMRMQV
jgi:flagellar hook-basal body complex protein FliE